ncbi:MAG: hypothetical protein AAGA96_16990 [Verrucomicrobiota bacterium]
MTKNPVKLLIAALALIAIGLLIAFFLTATSPETTESPEMQLSSPAPNTLDKLKARDSKPDDAMTSDQIPGEQARQARQDDLAIPVEGNPLLVTLAFYPELGQISIERYDKEGQPTGKPLKSGTEVHIPNPNIPGEKIRFVVP